jgi:signal transduction histidine kinase
VLQIGIGYIGYESFNKMVASRHVKSIAAPRQVNEVDYLRSARESGLGAICVLALMGMLTYGAMLVIDCSSSDCTGRIAPRVAVMVVFLALWVTVRAWPRFVVEHYALSVGSLIVILLAAVSGTILLISLNEGKSAGPAIVLTLFALYVFIRLPANALLVLGASTAILTYIVGIRLSFPVNSAPRTAIYFFLANALGYAVARAIERREQELLRQRRLTASHAAELQARTAAAEQAIEDKNRLLAAIGHDLRQPLRAAALHSGFLRDRLGAGDLVGGTQQAEDVARGLEMLSLTVDQLLFATREDMARDSRLAAEPVSSLFERVAWVFEDDCQDRGLVIKQKVADPGLVLHTDGEALFRVLLNLVGNAVKYAKVPSQPGADGRSPIRGVVIRAVRRDRDCLITISDNGIGMTPDECQHAWQPFYQAGSGVRRDRQGLGLGLYFVRQTLDNLPNHRVTLRSRYGRGSRFALWVPLATSGAHGGVDAEPSPDSPGGTADQPHAGALT